MGTNVLGQETDGKKAAVRAPKTTPATNPIPSENRRVDRPFQVPAPTTGHRQGPLEDENDPNRGLRQSVSKRQFPKLNVLGQDMSRPRTPAAARAK